MHNFELFTLEKYYDLEKQVKVHSRSLEMTLFNRADTTSYYRSIVTMPLSCLIDIFHFEKHSDLEIQVRGQLT